MAWPVYGICRTMPASILHRSGHVSGACSLLCYALVLSMMLHHATPKHVQVCWAQQYPWLECRWGCKGLLHVCACPQRLGMLGCVPISHNRSRDVSSCAAGMAARRTCCACARARGSCARCSACSRPAGLAGGPPCAASAPCFRQTLAGSPPLLRACKTFRRAGACSGAPTMQVACHVYERSAGNAEDGLHMSEAAYLQT